MIISEIVTWLNDEPRHRRGLRILQIACGLVILARLATEWRFVGYFWGPHGLQGQSTSGVFGAHLGRWIDALFATRWGTWGIVMSLALGAAGLVAGWQTRWASVVTALSLLAVDMHLQQLGDGGDNVMRLSVIYMMFALPQHARPKRGELRVWVHNLAILTMAAQVIILYTTAGLAKANGARWYTGTALYLINQVEWFSHPATRDLFKHPIVTTVATYLTVLFQVWFPMALFSRFKRLWIAVGMCMHIGIAVTMGLWMFSGVMIGLDLLLISDDEYRSSGRWLAGAAAALRARIRHRQPRLALFFDGACPHCRAFARGVAWVDVRGAIEARSFRGDSSHEAYGVTAAALESRMHVVELDTGRGHGGFAALELLARRLPLALPATPVLALLRHAGVGDRAYDWCAARRFVIADSRACGTACAVAPAIAAERAPK